MSCPANRKGNEMAKEYAIHSAQVHAVVNGRWVVDTDKRKVRVMARAEGYAMVRRNGCGPYVVCEKELSPPPVHQEEEK